MKKAIHHVMLNEKLDECFGELDQIQKTYRNYNLEYVKLVENHPQTMTTFFNDFEADVCQQFKIHEAAKKADILDMLKRETEDKQAKLEAVALKEWEAKQREEESK
jgi:hypothetical protein